MIWLVGIKYNSLEWPNGLARATRQSARVAVRIPMNTRVAISGGNLLPSLRRNLFSAPHPPTASQPRIRDSQHHRRWILLIAYSILRTNILCLGPLVVEIRDPAKFYTRRVAAQPKPQWQTTTVSFPSLNKMAKLLHRRHLER
jgi:hypothetical protein